MLPAPLKKNLTLPVIAAPMFLVSGTKLVTACCQSGVIGTFPALNARSSEQLGEWITQIKSELGEHSAAFGVNLVVHRSNERLAGDLEVIKSHKVPLVITSLVADPSVIEAVHSYGGVVFHDVVNLKFAKKAAQSGVDGLIAVCAGGGGHAGTSSPFALMAEIREFFDGTVLLAGALSSGRDIAAARALGADAAYMGTRFIATAEANASDDYKTMIEESGSADVVYTPKISGVPASFLNKSLDQHGVDLATHEPPKKLDFGSELSAETEQPAAHSGPKPWKDLWSAGQGAGAINNTPSVQSLISELTLEYNTAINELSNP